MKVYYESSTIDEERLAEIVEDFICPDAKDKNHECKLHAIIWQNAKEENAD